MAKVEEKVVSNQREINRILENGVYQYVVTYITVIERTTHSFWHKNPIVEQYTQKKTSSIMFGRQEDAEAYAKISSGCDHYINCWRSSLHINGDDAYAKYGYFELHTFDSGSSIYFNFHKRYHNQLSQDIYLGDFEKFCKDPVPAFESIKERIDMIDECKTVSKFDVVTMEAIPYDDLKASSEEMEELKRLITQYREDMQKYQDFLKKLLANQTGNK